MFLEVIATNVEDCIAIEKANAHRIELCSNLEQGGLTPEYEVIKKACESVNIPIRVMIRHTDRDFVYSDDEFIQMKSDIEFVKTTKAEGVVFGILNHDNTIDYQRTQQLISLAYPLKVSFHRAFDVVEDKLNAVKNLAKMKVNTILTCGGTKMIGENLDVFRLISGYDIEILAGSGVNQSNFKTLLQVADSIHIGTAVRKNNSWSQPILIESIKAFL